MKMKSKNHSSLTHLLKEVTGTAIVKMRSTSLMKGFPSDDPLSPEGMCYWCSTVVITAFSADHVLHSWTSPEPESSYEDWVEKWEPIIHSNKVKALCELYGFSVGEGRWTPELVEDLLGLEI